MRFPDTFIIGLACILSVVLRAGGATVHIAAENADRIRIQNAIDASRPGDTVAFEAGVFDTDRILFRSNRNYTGVPGATVLRFQRVEFGVVIDADAKDLTISGFTFEGAGIDMGSGGPESRYTNIRIIGNTFQDIPTNAIKCTMPNDRLVIERNTFKNVRGYGCVELYHVNRCSYSYNTLIDCAHGGHILGPLDDCNFSFNRATGLTHMGLEVQRSGKSISRNMIVEGNVFYDWKLPFCNSFGLSIVAEEGVNTRVVNNYLRASRVGPWNPDLEGQGERFGIGIEAGFDSGIVQGNIIGGPFAHYITASGQKMLFRGNKFFGEPVWKTTMSRWPGIHGKGTFIDDGNVADPDFSKMPAPPDPIAASKSSAGAER